MASDSVVFGGGCFWCTEAMFRDLRGVNSAESGYAGGTGPATYKDVCSGTTGHAEAIRVTFDPSVISRDDLLRIHMASHDPTTLNQQGSDYGTQYRSVIFFRDDTERTEAEALLAQMTDVWTNPIVTTLEPLTEFFPAEDYHQNYLAKFEAAGPLQKMGMNMGYCSAVVAPKVAKFRKEHYDKLKSTP